MKKVHAKVKKRRLRNLLKDLLDIYSPSGKEKDILNYLCGYLKEQKIPFKCQKVDENRFNIIVSPKNKVDTVFVGHVDTVSAFDFLNYKFSQNADKIYGLGASDMKSGCAAMIEAFIAFKDIAGEDFPASLVLVVGEEEEGDGIKAFLKENSFKWALVAEPTNLMPCLSHYGYLELELKTKGKRKHASLARPGHNAVVSMLRTVLTFTNYLDTSYRNLTYNIRDLYSADAGFAVPDRCAAYIDLHVPPKTSVKKVISDFKKLILDDKKSAKRKISSMKFSTVNQGYILSPASFLPLLIKEVYRKLNFSWKPSSFRSHSDANLLYDKGIKPVILGPGELSKAHAENESVSLNQVYDAGCVYFHILKNLNRSR